MHILIVEKRKLIAESLKLLFERLSFVRKVVCFDCLKDCLQLIKILPQKIWIVVQYSLLSDDFINCIKKLKFNYPSVKFICVFEPKDNISLLDFCSFIDGWISTEWTFSEFKNAMEYFLKEGIVVPKKVLFENVKKLNETNSNNLNKLTDKEKIILKLLCKGKINKEIAKFLNIKESTVKNHVYNIYKKLGIKRRAEAASKFSSFEYA